MYRSNWRYELNDCLESYNLICEDSKHLSELFKDGSDPNVRNKLRNLSTALSIQWQNAGEDYEESYFLIDADKNGLIVDNNDIPGYRTTKKRRCDVSDIPHKHYEKGNDIGDSVFDSTSIPNEIGSLITSFIDQKKYCIFTHYIHQENIKKYATRMWWLKWLDELKTNNEISEEIYRAFRVITDQVHKKNLLLNFLNDVERCLI